ncbi:hypothetical protein F4782DRAFT_477033 [Xylaria castorea]|nr:hypothetical protein F4782DRAFT_477033 [Xylaria castorea]
MITATSANPPRCEKRPHTYLSHSMATDQDKLLGTIREYIQQGSDSPSDADLAAFVDFVRTEANGEAILNSLLEAKEVSTSESFQNDDDDWKLKLRNQTPAVAQFSAKSWRGFLDVTAFEIKKKAHGENVIVWPISTISLLTASGTLYYDTVEQLTGPCGVTVGLSGVEFTARFWRSKSRLGKREMGDLIAVFIGQIDVAASDVKTFGGQGDGTWGDMRKGPYNTH